VAVNLCCCRSTVLQLPSSCNIVIAVELTDSEAKQPLI
jgi:hypothetical protein